MYKVGPVTAWTGLMPRGAGRGGPGVYQDRPV